MGRGGVVLYLISLCLSPSPGPDSVRFKAEVNFDGREVARLHINKLDLEMLLKVINRNFHSLLLLLLLHV